MWIDYPAYDDVWCSIPYFGSERTMVVIEETSDLLVRYDDGSEETIKTEKQFGFIHFKTAD